MTDFGNFKFVRPIKFEKIFWFHSPDFLPTIYPLWFCSGYVAPEYAIRNQVTRKSDIYSFGVLLLEIVSGRPNTNRRLPVKEQYLLTRV